MVEIVIADQEYGLYSKDNYLQRDELTKYFSRELGKVGQALSNILSKADKHGLVLPAKIGIAFLNNESIHTLKMGTVHYTDDNGSQSYLPVVQVSGLLHAEPWEVETALAHEIAHIIDYGNESARKGGSEDLTDKKSQKIINNMLRSPSQAIERRAIRISCRLVDDPWNIVKQICDIRQDKLKQNESIESVKDRKKYLLAWANKVATGTNRFKAITKSCLGDREITISASLGDRNPMVIRIVGGISGAMHTSLISLAHEVKRYCSDNNIAYNQEVYDDARQMDTLARNIIKSRGNLPSDMDIDNPGDLQL